MGDYKLIVFFVIVGMVGYFVMDVLFINLMKFFIDEGLNVCNIDVLIYVLFVVIVLVFGWGMFNYMLFYCLSYVGF